MKSFFFPLIVMAVMAVVLCGVSLFVLQAMGFAVTSGVGVAYVAGLVSAAIFDKLPKPSFFGGSSKSSANVSSIQV